MSSIFPSRNARAGFRRLFVGAALLAALATGSAVAQEPQVTVRMEPQGEIGVQEIVRLTVEIQNPSRDTRLPVFETTNLQVVGGPNQSTSVQFFNGVSSQTVAYTWMLQAQRLGAAGVRGIRVVHGSGTLELEDQNLQVVENPPPRQERRRPGADPFGRDPFDAIFDSPFRRRPRRPTQTQAPQVFLEAEVHPADPYVGQQVLYRLYLYTDVGVRSVSPRELPDFKGFWAKPIPQPDDTETERVVRDGREIGRVVLLERALFPRRAGRLEIDAVDATMTALMRDNSPFGSLLPRMGEIDRKSNAPVVEVRPLPEAPDGFDGIVGRVDLEAELEPQSLEIGEAATLTLTLSGEGHLQGIQAPSLTAVDGLEVFPPQQQSEETLRGRKVVGKRTWSYVLVPQKPGLIDLQEIEIAYFDPRARTFRSTSSGPLRLSVTGSTRAKPADGLEVELHPVRSHVLPGAAPPSRGLGSLGLGLALLPWLGIGFGLWWRTRRAAASHLEPSGSSPKALRKQLLTRLTEAEAEDQAKRTAALVEDAWRHYLERRWQIPPGTASKEWSTLLAEHNVSPQIADDLVRMVEDLHYLRYAPKLSSTEEMQRELLSRSQRLAKKL